jgi:hypothetical protein
MKTIDSSGIAIEWFFHPIIKHMAGCVEPLKHFPRNPKDKDDDNVPIAQR